MLGARGAHSAGFRLGEARRYIKLRGPLRLGFEAPADCAALSCSLFRLCLNPVLGARTPYNLTRSRVACNVMYIKYFL